MTASQPKRPVNANGRFMIDALTRQGRTDPLTAAISQHADMVYATCRRVLGNESDAADAAQETFFQFLKHAGRVRGSVGAWLHQVATRRSIDRIRQNVSRRRREEAYVADQLPLVDAWQEVEPLVDEALATLAPDTREILVLHYLEGQSMAAIGSAKGVSQPTVSRRVAAGLEELRELLQAKGVMVATGTLATLLAGAVEAAPAPLMQALGKMALAQAATGAAAAAGSGLGGLTKLGGLIAGGALLGTLAFLTLRPRPIPPTPVTNAAPSVVTFGFSTSVVWTIGPGGQSMRVMTTGTNFLTTNSATATSTPPGPARGP